MNYLRLRNLLLLFALVFALVLIVVIWIRRSPEAVINAAVKSLPEGVELSLKEIDYTHIEQGVARWRLVAEQVEQQSSGQALIISRPHLDFYDDQGNIQGTLDAEKGDVSKDYQLVQVWGDVVLKHADGYTFFTEALSYDHTKHLATTEETIKMIGDGLLLTGRGLELNTQTRHLTVFSDVDALYSPEEVDRKR